MDPDRRRDDDREVSGNPESGDAVEQGTDDRDVHDHGDQGPAVDPVAAKAPPADQREGDDDEESDEGEIRRPELTALAGVELGHLKRSVDRPEATESRRDHLRHIVEVVAHERQGLISPDPGDDTRVGIDELGEILLQLAGVFE